MPLYFAYGSNMDWAQMRDRCPSTKFVGRGRLPDHRLAFTYRSSRRGCGVADILSEKGAQVWGAVYDVSDPDLENLDLHEGYQPGSGSGSYLRIEVNVELDVDPPETLKVLAYKVRSPETIHVPPNENYKSLLVAGAKHWQLPEAYIQQLQAIQVQL